MTTNVRASAVLTLVSALFPLAAHGADCDRNFASSGNILTGQTYKTFAELPSVSADNAYDSTFQIIAKQGFSIAQADRNARVISALNSGSRPGRQIPLNATIEPSQSGAIISLSFSTPAGAFSQASDIKTEFCKIVAAAAEVRHDTAPSDEAKLQSMDAGSRIPTTSTNGDEARLCLANACIGMTLEEAFRLNLKSLNNSANFSPIKTRGGHYGLDASDRLVAMNITTIDKTWIKQYLQTVRTMCVTPARLHATTTTSDGTPVALAFDLTTQYGKVDYRLSSITRALPDNMSASERKNFESEVRHRYGRAFIENGDIARTVKAHNGALNEAVAMMYPGHLELLAPARPKGTFNLMEQPGCSNKARLD